MSDNKEESKDEQQKQQQPQSKEPAVLWADMSDDEDEYPRAKRTWNEGRRNDVVNNANTSLRGRGGPVTDGPTRVAGHRDYPRRNEGGWGGNTSSGRQRQGLKQSHGRTPGGGGGGMIREHSFSSTTAGDGKRIRLSVEVIISQVLGIVQSERTSIQNNVVCG